VGKKIEYLLSTGNLRSGTGLDLMQAKGFTVICDKLNNMRFLSHFRSIHRGAYFAEMKTTSVRKLLPENWGFICPVHTPDGGPCGLLNHITMVCHPVAKPLGKKIIPEDFIKLCVELGMQSAINDISMTYPPNSIHVLLDGKVIGYVSPDNVDDFIQNLRFMKI